MAVVFCSFAPTYRETRVTNSPTVSLYGFALRYRESMKMARLRFLARSSSQRHQLSEYSVI